MSQTGVPRLSIIVPNYRTLDFTRLCLRALRKHSQLPIQTIVVDNNSADASLDYLRKLSWIELVENRTEATGSLAHRQALDLGVTRAKGEWVVFFHSDTIVLKDGWDRELIGKAEARDAVGFSSTLRNVDPFESPWRALLRGLKQSIKGRSANAKLMSYCFGVRREILQASCFRFTDANDAVTDFYDAHLRDVHPFLLLEHMELAPILWHMSNVTSIVNQQMTDPRLLARFRRRSSKLYAAEAVRAVLADDQLDQ